MTEIIIPHLLVLYFVFETNQPKQRAMEESFKDLSFPGSSGTLHKGQKVNFITCLWLYIFCFKQSQGLENTKCLTGILVFWQPITAIYISDKLSSPKTSLAEIDFVEYDLLGRRSNTSVVHFRFVASCAAFTNLFSLTSSRILTGLPTKT